MNKAVFSAITVLLLIYRSTFAQTTIQADPDMLSSGISWTSEGIPSIKAGDIISFNRFILGGMIEARNEKRFNQGIFPNHNWRGIVKIYAKIFEREKQYSLFSFSTDFFHESAHPTMGIKEPTSNAYDLVYDDSYRRMMLNSLGISCNYLKTSGKNTITAQGDCDFYFLSKNTPELSSLNLGISHGISFGMQARHFMGDNKGLYISLFDRFIARGIGTSLGYVYRDNFGQPQNTLEQYPIISHANTIVVKTGYFIIVNDSHRKIEIFGKMLFGNPYGFIDSRDLRKTISFGIETSL